MNLFEYTKNIVRREIDFAWEKHRAYMKGFSDALETNEKKDKLELMRGIRNSLRKS